MVELKLLVERAKRRDIDAFGKLVRRFQDMALGYAYSILGRFDLAEDAAQEAFIQAWGDLPKLREPAAFPGWFKRIVFKHCDRLMRGNRPSFVPLDEASEVASDEPGPCKRVEESETRATVLEAMRGLPEGERTVTTLFYINGYSQKDISAFLDVPVTTVNNRLHASRKRLKERMLTMFGDELKNHTLQDEFPERIRRLLSLPRPLEVEGHPVRELWDMFRACFGDFEVVDLGEIIPRSISPIIEIIPEKHTFSVDQERILRPEVTSQLIERWMRTSRKPCKWITAGRVFRNESEIATRLEAFHHAELFWVGEKLGEEQLMSAVHLAAAKLMPGTEVIVRDEPSVFPLMVTGKDFLSPWRGTTLEYGAGGLGDSELMAQAGLDPERYGSIHFAFGLERCALVRYDLDDARELWQPPYVPENVA